MIGLDISIACKETTKDHQNAMIYMRNSQTNLILFDKTLSDEYTLRIAKIKFQQRKFEECLEILRNLSVDLKRQSIDDYLRFEYQWIQSEIQ